MGLDSGSKLERNYSFIKRYLLVFFIDPLPLYEKCHQDRQSRREVMVGSFIFDTWYHQSHYLDSSW